MKTIRDIILLGMLLIAGAAYAATEQVDNSAISSDGVIKASLTEQWRAGGDDDEIFFGNVGTAEIDANGNILLLVSQLSQVLVISPEGELVTTLGREGDGPGEVRRPGDMIISSDGTVCLLQGFPGRIVKINPDNTPAGEASYSTGPASAGQFVVLVRGLPLPDGMLLAGIRMSFAGAGKSVQDYFLSICNDDGVQQAQLFTKQTTIDFNNFELSELGMDFIWSRCATATDGTVYAAPERNRYLIEAFAEGPEPKLVFTRPMTAPKRTSQQSAVARKIIEGVGANYPVPPQRITIEDTPPVIAGMWVTDDNLLWVQTSPGLEKPPAGCWTVLDVFSPKGQYLRQVGIPGDFDPQQDSIMVLRDGRVLVIVGALDAFLNQQAVGTDENIESEADPLEIICYDLSLN